MVLSHSSQWSIKNLIIKKSLVWGRVSNRLCLWVLFWIWQWSWWSSSQNCFYLFWDVFMSIWECTANSYRGSIDVLLTKVWLGKSWFQRSEGLEFDFGVCNWGVDIDGSILDVDGVGIDYFDVHDCILISKADINFGWMIRYWILFWVW